METSLAGKNQGPWEKIPYFFEKYRAFLLSHETVITFTNGFLLLMGFVFSILFQLPQVGKWVYLASALTGGIPLFVYAFKQVFFKHNITSGAMGSVAMIAAIVVGEYSAAAIVVLMMSVGEWLENLTIARADQALQDLNSLIPNEITLLKDGKERKVSITDIQIGDIVLVRTGERIGLDGAVLRGNGCVNQSVITGESIPVDKRAQDDVYAGTLMDSGALEISVTRIGADTTLGRIGVLVKSAQASQAPVQRIANQYASVLVPITFGIAILTYILTGDIIRSITILVVVCPCALVLATPTAVVAAIGNAARHGILVKTGAAIEMTGKIDTVAFDKTGTLTLGKLAVREVFNFNEISQAELLHLTGSLERYSEHPIGRALVTSCEEKGLPFDTVSNLEIRPGFGLVGTVLTRRIVVGTQNLMLEENIQFSELHINKAKEIEENGHTLIFVSVDGILSGMISLADILRETASSAVQALKNLGIKEVILITGDREGVAKRIADQIGVERYFAQVLPEEKLAIVRRLQAEGKKVLFVGDGVNDAPALAAADVGVAMGLGGTGVALETADIGLMTDEISKIPQLVALSQKTLKVIRANVFFSMAVNLVSVILGGIGWIGPVVGALIHEGSSVPVLANSARMVGYPIEEN